MPIRPEYTRLLPHFHHVGATFFVTFRLYGTLPIVFLNRLNDWYEFNKSSIQEIQDEEEREKTYTNLQREYFRKLDAALDKCFCGPDHLKLPAVAQCLIQQLHRFDGEWYNLFAYTIMPNHVHLLLDLSVQTKGSEWSEQYKNLDYVMWRIKGASSRNANLVLGKTGTHFWQQEYHDRYIRDMRHFHAAVNYIKQNPVSARLCTHWLEHPFTWVKKV